MSIYGGGIVWQLPDLKIVNRSFFTTKWLDCKRPWCKEKSSNWVQGKLNIVLQRWQQTCLIVW